MTINKPKQTLMGTATNKARERHKPRGSPASTSINGRATSVPSVSPTHHVTQLIKRSVLCIAPSAHIPVTDRVELVRQTIGERSRKSRMSRRLSKLEG